MSIKSGSKDNKPPKGLRRIFAGKSATGAAGLLAAAAILHESEAALGSSREAAQPDGSNLPLPDTQVSDTPGIPDNAHAAEQLAAATGSDGLVADESADNEAQAAQSADGTESVAVSADDTLQAGGDASGDNASLVQDDVAADSANQIAGGPIELASAGDISDAAAGGGSDAMQLAQAPAAAGAAQTPVEASDAAAAASAPQGISPALVALGGLAIGGVALAAGGGGGGGGSSGGGVTPPQTLSVSLAQALAHAGPYNASDTVVVKVADADLASLVSHAAALHAANVDLLSASDGSLTLSAAQAASLIKAGLVFAEGNDISLDAQGVDVLNSLKDLQKLGVSFIPLGGGAGLDLGPDSALSLVTTGTPLDPTHIPHFSAADDVNLNITDSQVHEVAGLAAHLDLAGIDHIGAVDGSLTLGGADLHEILSHGVDFAPQAQVTAELTDASLTDLVHDVGAAAAPGVGVDHVDMVDNTASITETQAATLIHAGIDFAVGDTVDMQAEGTHVATSLKDLHDLGVDHVNVDAAAVAANVLADPLHPGHDLMLELGNVATGADPAAELLTFLETYKGHPVFNQNADVLLEVTQQVYDAVSHATTTVNDNIVTALVNLGVDEVKVIGTDVEHDVHNLH